MIRLAGDKAIKDLTPQTINIGGRMVKNMRICGSGCYKYHRSEAAVYGLDTTMLPGDQMFFHIYRPAEVLIAEKDKFARVPIITGSHVIVDTTNAKRLTVGLVGDSVDYEVGDDGETYLYTTGTIIAGDGVNAYEYKGQLSVGYVPRVKWQSGVHKGQKYEAVLEGFDDINHILICGEARGGAQCSIMDSNDHLSLLQRVEMIGGNKVSVFTKIFGDKKPKVVGDSRIPVILQSIAAGADPDTQVKAINEIMKESKIAGDTKATWDEYLGELSKAKGTALAEVAKAVDVVSKYYTEKVCAGDTAEGEPDRGAGVDSKDAVPKEGSTGEDGTKTAGDEVAQRVTNLEATVGKLAESVSSLVTSMVPPKPSAGDSVKADEPTPKVEAAPTIAGDSTTKGSDYWFKEVVK